LDLTVLPLDVTSDQQAADAIGEAERQAGGALDVLVNNAGINIHGPVEVQDIAAMQLSFDTNVMGLQRTTRAALPAMRARKSGLIVNVSSQVGRFVTPMGGVYSATKFAVESMSEQLAYELVAHGIEVCIIQPGGFPTSIGANRARLTAALAERTPEQHASGYPEAMAAMRARPPAGQPQAAAASPGRPDPEDVPRAMAEVIAMAPGTRPLRVPVHPGPKPQLEINRVSRETQLAVLGRGPWAEAARAVHD
ncbi:MAG TPA: SDR family NAD(P)-dependent oxidoreductase, partial [Novosphingobium sp.]|nr:SDR family NAD(P)-dependent oxidoreductase [Novosphingobium sp.]